MDLKDIQKQVDDKFREHFGYTPLGERLKDIQSEFFELMKWQDVKNLKEETGDLLSSLLKLCSESGWNAEELIGNTLTKIDKRADQYKTLGRKTKVAILGGAFNPPHRGHIQLAQFVLNTSKEFDEVWLMPAYSHMYNKEMASAEHRLAMCEIAAKADGRIKVFDYEIRNKLKGETYYFFKRLKEETELTEKYQFAMIIGLDNANSFDRWVNYQELERMAQFVVVPRLGIERDTNVNWYLQKPHIFLNGENTIMEASSTLVRNGLYKEKFDILKYLPENETDYIYENKLYYPEKTNYFTDAEPIRM
jgi:nicotinate-nucleotide adenylyltransferase